MGPGDIYLPLHFRNHKNTRPRVNIAVRDNVLIHGMHTWHRLGIPAPSTYFRAVIPSYDPSLGLFFSSMIEMVGTRTSRKGIPVLSLFINFTQIREGKSA